jgi:hypothetical protein
VRDFVRFLGVGISLMMVAGFTEGCVKVPTVDTEKESVRLVDLVKRMKCDMYYAVSTPKETRSGTVLVPISSQPGYEWLSNWVIQTNLNLIVNDQSGISPGASFVEPLNSVALLGKGTFSQSYTTGVSGGVNTTAQRSESFSFSLSLAEIEAELGDRTQRLKQYNDCFLKNGSNLDSDLQLNEWFWSSLAPVREHYLRPGLHKSPKSAGTSTPAQGGAKALASSSLYREFIELQIPGTPAPPQDPNVDQLKKLIPVVSKTIALVQSTYDEEVIKPNGSPTPGAVSDRELEHVYDQEGDAIIAIDSAISIVDKNPDDKAIDAYISTFAPPTKKTPVPLDLKTFKQYLQSVETSFVWDRRLYNLSKSKVSSPQLIKSLITKLDSDIQDLETFTIASDIVVQLRTVRAQLTAALSSFDAPIDSISHQVQFVVAWSGDVNPAWSLVRFRGPGPSSGSLLSGSTSDTHTLSVVIGPPGADTTNTLNALQIGNSLQNALNSVTVKTTAPP